jgi:hypothetical protein
MFEYNQAELDELTLQIVRLGEAWRRVAELMSETPEAQPKPPVTILLL